MRIQNLKNNHYFEGSTPHLNTVVGLIGTGSVEGAMSAGATAYSIPQIDDKLQEQGFSEEVRQAKLINFGLGLLSLGVGGNMPTEYKRIQGVDSISTGYESFKDSLVNTPLAQYAQTEMGKYEYCQKQPNAKACMDSINHSNVDPILVVLKGVWGGLAERLWFVLKK